MPADENETERLHEWAAVLDESTYYELLGVRETADGAALKTAFHDFARAFHPDSHLDFDAHQAQLSRRIFQRGAEAYRVLSNPELRSRYDLALVTGQVWLVGSQVPRVADVGGGAQSLVELCRTASAVRYATRADALISIGELRLAKKELMLAIREDGANSELAERLDALDLALFAMGL